MFNQLINNSLNVDCELLKNFTKENKRNSLLNYNNHDILMFNESYENVNKTLGNFAEIVPYPTFDLRALVFVIIYCCVFIVAAIGNVTVFVNLFRFRRRKSHISLMIIHLTLADLIVTFIMLPFEIAWRLTVQWMGGNLACKVLLFFRAFGLYLSSNILICISCDRYFAVVHPLMVTNKRRRGKLMIYCAWFASILYALPQMFIFHVEIHPIYANFTQCVSFGFFSSATHEFIYNLACLMAMYFIPLIVIFVTYTSILWVMWKKAHESTSNENIYDKNQTTRSNAVKLRKCRSQNHYKGVTWNISDTTSTQNKGQLHKQRDNVLLRYSGMKCIERARVRTLKMTIFIVIIFLVCWTPYVFMTLWYMIDRKSAEEVPMWMQDALFMMAVSNSSMNPILYGRFTLRTLIGRNNKGSKYPAYMFCCFSGSEFQHNVPLGRLQDHIKSHPGVAADNIIKMKATGMGTNGSGAKIKSQASIKKETNCNYNVIHTRPQCKCGRLDGGLIQQLLLPEDQQITVAKGIANDVPHRSLMDDGYHSEGTKDNFRADTRRIPGMQHISDGNIKYI